MTWYRSLLSKFAVPALALSLYPIDDLEAARSRQPVRKTRPYKKTPAPKTYRAPRTAQRDPQAAATQLQARVVGYIDQERRKGDLGPYDQVGMVVYDIDHSQTLVSLKADQKMMAASTIKDFVMLAYFDRVSRGELFQEEKDHGLLKDMIQKSSNKATNKIMERLGGPAQVERILAQRYPFFNETDVREFIPKDGRTYLNTTSPHDLNIYYNQLWKNTLPGSKRMGLYLMLPKRSRLHSGTCIPSEARVYNKTGTVYGMVADSGIIVLNGTVGKKHPYIVTVMIENTTLPRQKGRDGSWVKKKSQTIRDLSSGVYDYLYQMHTGEDFTCKRHKGRHLTDSP